MGLLSVILFGFDGMQLITQHQANEQFYSTIAELQLQNIHSKLAALGSLNGMQDIILKWNNENKKFLPNGLGNVTGYFPQYKIELCWQSIMKHKQCLNSEAHIRE